MSSALRPVPAPHGIASRVATFWSLFVGLVATDIITKRAAEQWLVLHVPRPVLGEWFRLTLTYNTGAAMNLSLGGASRVGFTVVATCMLGIIFQMYRRTPARDALQAAALALIASGALGNLIDRLRSPRGVVDFIDLGLGDARFWTFNVADMGVTLGAVLLTLLLMRRPATGK